MTQKKIAKGHDYQEDIGVTRRPGVMNGQACIAGTRIPITGVRNWSAEEIKRSWPYLSNEQIENVVRYWKIRGTGRS